jgi:molecular chaperone DnaK
VSDKSGLVNVNFQGRPILPSALLYEHNIVTIGISAKARAVINNERYIESSKTSIGSLEPLKIIDGREFNPTDVASEILKEVKKSIINQFGFDEKEEIKAVITVPAYFESSQKRETRTAGENAGFVVEAIIHEPSAAAMAYATTVSDFKNVYVIDIGGGTFDVALIEKKGDVYEEKIVSGDSRLGGNDFNKVIYDMILRYILTDSGIDLTNYDDCRSYIGSEATYFSLCQKLKNISENAKIELSSLNESSIDVPVLFVDIISGQPYNLSYVITRKMFENKAKFLFDRIENIIRESFSDENINRNGYQINDVEHILFMGGSSAITRLSDIVRGIFNKQPERTVDTSKGVAIGAALVGYNSENNERGIGGISRIEYHELLAHSIGTMAWCSGVPGCFSEILKQGSTYPVSNTLRIRTSSDRQSNLRFMVIEGNNKYALDNTYYAEFVVENLTKRPRGQTSVELTYSLDVDGILDITAHELESTNDAIKLSVNISESKENPLRSKVSKKYKNIFLMNTDISSSPEFDWDKFEENFSYEFMSSLFYYLYMFDNPSLLLYNGINPGFSTDPAILHEQFEFYFVDNTVSSNYPSLKSNIKCIQKIIESSDDNYNIFVLSDNGTELPFEISSSSNVNVYYIDYNCSYSSSNSNRKSIRTINALSSAIFDLAYK